MNYRRINKSAVVLIGLMTVLISFTSCFVPTSKEAYLDQFSRFVDNVREDHRSYNKSDWKYADERFKKFRTEWHDLFKDDLTLKEELKVAALIVQYNSYKGVNKLEKLYNDEVKDDVDELKEKIQYYIDNDMDEDLEKLKEGAKEIGDSAINVVEEIIEKISD
ncbi:MAG: hypothetical protein HQ541_11575 [Mariniphaga sp.]|nr:hypothetical protein [Mariniphaga sp.]